MTKGCAPVGMAEVSRRAKIAFAGFLVVVAIGFITPLVWMVRDNIKDNRLTAVAKSNAQFRVGDIVQSKIARFRGIVIGVYCEPNGCTYEVRFDGASMQPQDMGEYELEAWHGP